MSKESKFVKAVTDGTFQEEVVSLSATTPVLVDFWAEWCSPCRALSPIVEEVAQANAGLLAVTSMNVDENVVRPQEFGIQGIPTLLLFKDGKVVHQMVGYQSQGNIQRSIDEALGK